MSRILLVDDEQAILQSLSLLLKSEGHETTTITQGEMAKEALETDSFDLMITDIRMSPIDGMELLKIAQEYNPGMPSIVVSAYSSDEASDKAFELGCKAYIKKPFIKKGSEKE